MSTHKISKISFFIFIVFFSAAYNVCGFASVFYVSKNGTKTSGASIPNVWDPSNCYQTIEAAISQMSGGDEVVVNDGTYYLEDGNFINYGKVNIPNGLSRSQFTVIRARNRLEVRIENRGVLSYYDCFVRTAPESKYIHIDGFVYVLSNTNYPPKMFELNGSYNKITNCIAVRKGIADNYCSAFAIQGHHNLIENCAATGHTRYLFTCGGADSNDQYNIFRRCIGRADYSDSDQPMAVFNFYGNNSGTSTNSMLFQNCIALDGHQMSTGKGIYAYAWGGFYFPKNAYQATLQGCIVLNQDARYGGFAPIEMGGGKMVMENCISWDNKNSSGTIDAINLRGSGDGITINHCTFGACNRGIGNFNNGALDSKNLKNCLFWGNETIGTVGGWGVADHNAFYPVGQTFGANPIQADHLSYILRIDKDSVMKGAGSDGRDVGATIVKMYGKPGSFWGEPGYDKLQDGTDGQENLDLWPWPNEEKIRELFRETNDPPPGAVPSTNDTKRGFCADGMTLTKYIWEYLGNPIPPDIYGQAGNTYYVSPQGDDSATGTSISSAWKTIQHAADEVEPGDTVIVETGSYSGFYVNKSGESDNRIVFRADGEVVINGCIEYDDRNACIHVTGSYITIDGFKCLPTNGSHDRGIRVSGTDSNMVKGVQILNCKVENAGWCGITSSYAEDIRIEGNTVSGSLGQHGIYVANSADRPIIRNNVCYDNDEAGIQINADMELPGDHIISGAIVENNVLYNNGLGGSAAINLASVRDSRICNNLLYNNHGGGIANWDDGYSDWGDPGNYTYGCKNNVYANNTVVMPAGSRHALSFRNGSTGNLVKNNILIHLGSADSIAVDAESLSGLDSDYNIVTRFENTSGNIVDLSTWKSAYNLDSHSFVATLGEIFKDLSGNDYDLKDGSVAIDKGTVVDSVQKDILNRERPHGNGYDIGAYEYQGDIADTTPPVISDISVTNITANSATITWVTNETSNGTVEYGITTSYGSTKTDSSMTTTHSVEITNLEANTTYHFRVQSADGSGNESNSDDQTFTTLEGGNEPQERVVIEVGDQWKYFKGTTQPPSNWNTVGFDDSSWSIGATGIGYDDGDDATVLNDMRYNYLTVFCRKTFSIPDASKVTNLYLSVDIDDGFIAYLNGQEVARYNVATAGYNQPATTWRDAGTPIDFDLSEHKDKLVSGNNVLAIEVHNSALESSDLSFIPRLTVKEYSGDTTPPGDITNLQAVPGPEKVTFTWTNPGDNDFAGVMIRYRNDGVYPQNINDGNAVPNGNNGKIPGSPGQNASYVHDNLDPTKHYYYSFFTYDTSGNYSHTVHIAVQPLAANHAPTITSFIVSPTSINNPYETATFTASATDQDGDTLTYTINFGDGNSATGQTVTHAYTSQGQYTVVLTVSDGNGGTATKQLTVNVSDLPPAAPTGVQVSQ